MNVQEEPFCSCGVIISEEYPAGRVPSKLTITGPTPSIGYPNIACPLNKAGELNQVMIPELMLKVVSKFVGSSGPNLKFVPPAATSAGVAKPTSPVGDTI